MKTENYVISNKFVISLNYTQLKSIQQKKDGLEIVINL